MIIVLWAALLIAGTRAAIRWHLMGDRPEFDSLTIPINDAVYPMPILAALLWTLDRPGRVRDWYLSGCMIAASFLGGILFSLQDPICYALTGRPTIIFPMGPICALAGFWSGWKQWQTARPRRCPSCGARSVVPVAHPIRPGSKRRVKSGKQGWCTGCGADCEREGTEDWRATKGA